MAELDYTTNPWPAIRELQGIVGNVTSEIEELKERLQIMEDSTKKTRLWLESLEEVVNRLEGK